MKITQEQMQVSIERQLRYQRKKEKKREAREIIKNAGTKRV